MNKNIPFLFTIITIIGNYGIPKYYNKSVGYLAEENKLEVQPARWAFPIIWTLIYSSLIYLTYNISNGTISWNNKSYIFYISSCVFNLLWLNYWLSERLQISQFILIGLVISLGLLWYENIGFNNNRIYQNIIATYLSWTVGASLLNIFIVNKKDNITSSNTVIYLLSIFQILWQIIQKKPNQVKDSIMFPIAGVYTSLGIALNPSMCLGPLKILPLIVSLICTLIHYNKLQV